jgi:tetratricopeptide (TPR) repeat protein
MRMFLSFLIILLISCASIWRNASWMDDRSVWGDSIRKSPGKARGYNELGLQLLADGHYQEAYELLTRSLKLEPYQGQAYINIGMTLEHLGQTKKAIDIYEKAVWMQPDDPTAYYNLGVLYYRTMHDRDRALGYFLKARDLNPREPDVHEYLAYIYGEEGDTVRSQEEMALSKYLKQ